MKRTLILLLALIATSPAVAQAASPLGTYPNCVNPLDGFTVSAYDDQDGQEIEQGVCFPMLRSVSGTLPLDVRTTTNADGPLGLIRIGVADSGVGAEKTAGVTLTGTQTTRVDTLTWNTATATVSGWRETRSASKVHDARKGDWFPTARWCVNIVSSKPNSNYCGGPTVFGRCGGGGWLYTQYDNVWMDCRDVNRRASTVPQGWCFHVNLGTGAGQAFVDGVRFYNGAAGSRTLCLPVLSSGVHSVEIRKDVAQATPALTGGAAFGFRVRV